MEKGEGNKRKKKNMKEKWKRKKKLVNGQNSPREEHSTSVPYIWLWAVSVSGVTSLKEEKSSKAERKKFKAA